jgi:hypothetical protein
MTPPKLSVIPTANQEALSNTLMDELRAVMNKPEYGNVYYSTTIGVLEMLKMELYEGLTL